VADLGFWKGGAMVGKKHFLRIVRGGKNSFSFAFTGKNRKIFLEGRGNCPHCPPLNPPLQLLLCFFRKEKEEQKTYYQENTRARTEKLYSC
jgi:hypothetical protein